MSQIDQKTDPKAPASAGGSGTVGEVAGEPSGDRGPEPIDCRRCGVRVVAEKHEGEGAVNWLWRCSCGWARAQTGSGLLSRSAAQDAIARALERIERED